LVTTKIIDRVQEIVELHRNDRVSTRSFFMLIISLSTNGNGRRNWRMQ